MAGVITLELVQRCGGVKALPGRPVPCPPHDLHSVRSNELRVPYLHGWGYWTRTSHAPASCHLLGVRSLKEMQLWTTILPEANGRTAAYILLHSHGGGLSIPGISPADSVSPSSEVTRPPTQHTGPGHARSGNGELTGRHPVGCPCTVRVQYLSDILPHRKSHPDRRCILNILCPEAA